MAGPAECYSAMKRRALLAAFCAASALVITLSTASGTAVTLRSAIPIPSYCNVTPVYGDYIPGASPFIVAQPRFSEIVMRLSEGVPRSLVYEPIASGGADVLLEAHSSSVVITGTYTRFTGTVTHSIVRHRFYPLLLHTGYYQRLNLPDSGCWHLRLQAGTETGNITLWVQ